MRAPVVLALVVLVALAGCETAAAPADGGAVGDAGGHWRVVAGPFGAAILVPTGADGCLVESGERLDADELRHVLASDGRFALVREDGAVVRLAEAPERDRPAMPPFEADAVVRRETARRVYDETGCPVADGGALLAEDEPVLALARSFDASYRGYVVVDRDLGLAPVREVDREGWTYPWHASLQLVREVPEGFVIGGGILIGPRTILTAGHLGVEPGWCYSRQPNSGRAWEAGLFVCDNVAAAAERHPDDVDVALVTLSRDEPPPYAILRETSVEVGEPVYTSRWSMNHRNAFADSAIEEVGSRNAFCATWPELSTFSTVDDVIGPGDSGGPAWIGDELVGIVHGEACRGVLDPTQHLWVHVPGVLDFVAR